MSLWWWWWTFCCCTHWLWWSWVMIWCLMIFFFFLGKKHFVEKFYDLGQKYLCSWTWWVCAKHGRRPWKMVWRSSHLKAKRLYWMLGLESSSPWTLDMLAGQSYPTTWRLSFVLWQWLFPIYNKSVKLCCSLKGWSLPTSYTLFFLKLTVGLSCVLIYIFTYIYIFMQ